MIKYYRVQNFKGLIDVKIEFGWINVLIGPNSSGKTTILESIDFFKAFFESSVDLFLEQQKIDLTDLKNKFNKKKIISYEIKLELLPNEAGLFGGDYSYKVEYNTDARRINKEELTYLGEEGEKTLFKRDISGFELYSFNNAEYKGQHIIPSAGIMAFFGEKFKNKFPEINHFKDRINNIWSFFIWDPKLLKKASREEGGLGRFGERLASTLYDIKKSDEDTFTKILRTVRKNIPRVVDIEFESKRPGWKKVLFVERYSDEKKFKFRPSQISDGALRILALAIIRHVYSGGTITLEEPENGIHPKLVKNIVNILMDLTKVKLEKRCQVIFTTHSPYVLDQFHDDYSAVYIVEKGNSEVGTVVKRLGSREGDEEKQIIAEKLFNESLGELWYSGILED